VRSIETTVVGANRCY